MYVYVLVINRLLQWYDSVIVCLGFDNISVHIYALLLSYDKQQGVNIQGWWCTLSLWLLS